MKPKPGEAIKIAGLISLLLISLLIIMSAISFNSLRQSNVPYVGFSRCTDPGDYAWMLRKTSDDIQDLCDVVRHQVIHHLLLYYTDSSLDRQRLCKNDYSSRAVDLLKFIHRENVFLLDSNSSGAKKFIGTCTTESYLLACLLRYHGYKVRIRAGFLKDIRQNENCICRFWKTIAQHKADAANMTGVERDCWLKRNEHITCREIETNHHIAHWICEIFDPQLECWRLLDANTDFLKYHSNMQVDIYLTPANFQYAHEAWLEMRKDINYNSLKYRDDDQGGRSHIRSMLLWDFYGMLNHDLAGSGNPDGALYKFIRNRHFCELPEPEKSELDSLAALLSKHPDVDELVEFYLQSETLRFDEIESDPFSFVYKKRMFISESRSKWRVRGKFL